MFGLQIKYLSFFFGITSVLSFFNIIYSYYFNLYLNLDTYYYTLITSILIFSIFYKFGNENKKSNIFKKILTIFLGYLLIPLILSIPLYFSIYDLTFINSCLSLFQVLHHRIFNFWKYKTYRPKLDNLEIINSMDWWFVFFIFNYIFDRYLWWKF